MKYLSKLWIIHINVKYIVTINNLFCQTKFQKRAWRLDLALCQLSDKGTKLSDLGDGEVITGQSIHWQGNQGCLILNNTWKLNKCSTLASLLPLYFYLWGLTELELPEYKFYKVYTESSLQNSQLLTYWFEKIIK